MSSAPGKSLLKGIYLKRALDHLAIRLVNYSQTLSIWLNGKANVWNVA